MKLKKIIKLFEAGNVNVSGLKGRGKDMLMANVAMRRKKPYIANVDYGGKYIPLDLKKMTVGGNTYVDFLEGTVKRYNYPYEDGIDFYISDAGIYFPSQYNSELDRKYRETPIFMALSRQLGDCSVHTNAQQNGRVWLKIREQSDIYILCNKCIYIKFLKLVIQKVTVYEYLESAERKLRELKLPRVPLLAANRRQLQMQRDITIANHKATHGEIKEGWLIYRNKSNYNTRIFKEILENGKEEENNTSN